MHQISIFCSGLQCWHSHITYYDNAVNIVISKPKGRFEVFISQLLIHSFDENLALTVQGQQMITKIHLCVRMFFFIAPSYFERGHRLPQAALVRSQLLSFNCRIGS